MNIRIVFSLVAVLLLVASCCTQRTARTASLSNSSGEVRIVRDSVFVLDSVLLRERADTVFLTRIRTLYRDRLSSLGPEVGLEPTSSCERRILSPLRLPIPPARRTEVPATYIGYRGRGQAPFCAIDIS